MKKKRPRAAWMMPLILLMMAGLVTAPAARAQLSQTKIVPADAMEGDLFGGAVAIQGNRLVVGVRTADINNVENAGAAYVFERIDGQWEEVQKLTSNSLSDRDFFGESVALDGTHLLIGEMGNDDRIAEGGAVHAFEYIDGQWEHVQVIHPDDPQDFHGFGWEIALEGDEAFISAPQDEDIAIQAGAVYLFEWDDFEQEWVQKQKLLPTSTNFRDISFFGTAMGRDGDRIVISSPTDREAADLAGAAYVFRLNRGVWVQTDKLLPPPVALPDSLEGDTFSRELAFEGDWALISSSDDEVCIEKGDLIDPDRPNACTSGAVFAFQRQSNGDWDLKQKIAPDELEQFDFFGFLGIAIENGRAVIGTRGDDDACPDPPPPRLLFCDPGALYVYDLVGDEWQKTAKLTAADADSLDFLGGVLFGQGRPVGISGSFIVGGAPTIGLGEDISTKGKVYVFKMFNQDPVAADDEAETGTGAAVTIDVLANDSDPDFDALSVSIAQQPANGTATANADGTITYTPSAGFSGSDAFTYEIDDGDGGTDEATVTVTRSNAAPIVSQTLDDVSLILGADAFTIDLSAVFSDPDGDPLTFSAGSSNNSFATASVSGPTLTVEAVALGSATITATADDGLGGTASTSFGVSIPTGVAAEQVEELPTTFELSANYPNPFNPATQIRFGLPQAATVRLAVFDVLGREVAVLVDERLPAGWHEAVFEAGDLPSGVYLYQLDAGGRVLARTMLLVK